MVGGIAEIAFVIDFHGAGGEIIGPCGHLEHAVGLAAGGEDLPMDVVVSPAAFFDEVCGILLQQIRLGLQCVLQ